MPTATVLIYTTPFCGYCAAAKSLLNKKAVDYKEIDISGDEPMREKLITITGRTSVPQIFINDEHIGGFDDMAALDSAGELDPRLGL
ncbi:MAG: glutaredoxin 3 [Gammaproteobacteria bacterium]|nr:glutaredoxin 3 [Gammaproteobacteria bacterium]